MSWWGPAGEAFELGYPWWVTGVRRMRHASNAVTFEVCIVAAIVAPTEEEAMDVVEGAYEGARRERSRVLLERLSTYNRADALIAYARGRPRFEWRYRRECSAEWSPFSARYPRRPGMRWPAPIPSREASIVPRNDVPHPETVDTFETGPGQGPEE